MIITTLDGCMDPLLPLKKWRELMVTIGVGSILEMDACGKRLVQMGYERTGQVELPGQFAIRGGILDVYPLTEEYPVRIELWDDEVDSIRSFDPRVSVPWKIWRRSRYIQRPSFRQISRDTKGKVCWIISKNSDPWYF